MLFQQAGAAVPSVISEEAWKESPAPSVILFFFQRTSGAFAMCRIAGRKGFYKAQSWASVCPASLLPKMRSLLSDSPRG